MKKRSAAGGACAGRPLEKTANRRAYDRLHRRKRNGQRLHPGGETPVLKHNFNWETILAVRWIRSL